MSVVANVAINVDSRNAVSKLRQVQSESKATERAVNGLGAAVGKLAAVFTAAQAVKFVFVQAAEIESQRKSLEVLTGSAQKAGKIIKELQQLGAVTPFTSTELIDAAKRLQAFGVEANNVVETTRRLADVSGATGAELQGLVTAYGQVQAKGRLQGEELLQFQERGVALQQELRKQYNLSGEEFQKALSKGQISAEAVEFAIKKLTAAGGKYANGAIAQSDTLNGKLSTLQDSFQRLAQNIGTFFAPVFKFLIDGINAFIERVNSASRLQAQTQAYQEAGRRTRARFGARVMNPFDREVQEYRARLEKSLIPSMMGGGGGIAPSAPVIGAAPRLLTPAVGRAGTTGGRTARAGSDDAERAAGRLAEQTKQQIKAAQDLQFTQRNQLAVLRAKEEFEKAFVTFATERAEIERRYNELLANSKSQQETQLLQQARTAEYKQNSLKLEQEIQSLTKQATAPLDEILKRIKDQAAFEREYGELIKNGTNPELAKQIIEIRRAYDESVKALEPALAAAQAAVTKAEAEGASATAIQKYREELERIEKIRKGLEGKKDEAIAGATAAQPKDKTEGQKIEERIKVLKDDIKELTSLSNQVTKAAEAMGAAFSNAFTGLVSGAMTGQEALASFFKGVGDHFMDMAAQMIAKLIQIWILQTVLGMIGGGKSVFGSGGAPNYSGAFGSGGPSFNPGAFAMPKLAAEGAYWPGGFQAFADGGLVTKPTMGLIGEGGEAEYIIPASKMRGAMERYGAGARGAGVIPNGRDSGGTSGAAGTTVIDVRYNVERINSVDYVTADEFQAGIRQAAAQGAAQGEQRTLRKLQMSPSVRRRVGV